MARVPKAAPVQSFTRRAQHAAVLTAMIYYRKNVKKSQRREKVPGARTGENQTPACGSLPLRSHPPARTWGNTCGVLSAGDTHWTLSAPRGNCRGGSPRLPLPDTDQMPGPLQKAGTWHRPRCSHRRLRRRVIPTCIEGPVGGTLPAPGSADSSAGRPCWPPSPGHGLPSLSPSQLPVQGRYCRFQMPG